MHNINVLNLWKKNKTNSLYAQKFLKFLKQHAHSLINLNFPDNADIPDNSHLTQLTIPLSSVPGGDNKGSTDPWWCPFLILGKKAG